MSPCSSTTFTPRTGHDCIQWKDKVYLFGGTDDDDRKNDLLAYDLYANTWTLLPAQGQLPQPRSGAKGVYFDKKLFLFGGYQKNSGSYYKDLFYYDIELLRWVSLEQKQTGQVPSRRTDHSVVLWDGRMFVFGGYDGEKRYGDLYKCCLKN